MKATAETFGIAGPEFLPPVWPDPPAPLPAGEDVAWLAVVQATLDLTHGDTSSAVEALAAAAAASHRFPPAVEASRAFQVGRLQILRGDVEGGLRAMEAGLRAAEIAPMVEMAPPTFFHRIFLAEAHAEHPPTRGRGIEELRGLLGCCPPIEPLIRLYLGRALEAEGQQRAALVQYGIFAMQTDRAEGSLAAMNAEARRAIKRLAVEG
ncbi:MAG: hypothetical protein GWM90_08835 [Gemmatimonadetes bacterium]|nr:hypothetical protein [Gemmatimonadota bacterium]NIQ53999.1 hypothetical protein [Gemmatimonadota bacterium]NIU74183.1 hypothetical protein [Gammaproteobacteria bacterium]NIX44214.1 hypothetical protein [Gemmatimonadota bacterium]NIY08445.1 hypothetical protein [Gemmatimonadota bacterium]